MRLKLSGLTWQLALGHPSSFGTLTISPMFTLMQTNNYWNTILKSPAKGGSASWQCRENGDFISNQLLAWLTHRLLTRLNFASNPPLTLLSRWLFEKGNLKTGQKAHKASKWSRRAHKTPTIRMNSSVSKKGCKWLHWALDIGRKLC